MNLGLQGSIRRESVINNRKYIARIFYQTIDAIGAGQAEVAAFDQVAADTFQAHLPGGPTVDREGFKGVVQAFGVGFPGATHTIEEILADEKVVAIRITWRGKHTGVFQGAPATHKDIEMSEMGMMRIEGGKVVEFWPLFDSMNLMMGTGIVKLSAPEQ